MRSVVFDRHGDPARVLRLDADDVVPKPGAGEVLVRVLVRPLHPGDLVGVTGYSDSAVFDQPRSPGLEGMRVVEELGQGVTRLETGRRVAFFPVPGTLREYITAPARFVVPVPDEITDTTAALLLVNTLTMRDLLGAAEEAWRVRHVRGCKPLPDRRSPDWSLQPPSTTANRSSTLSAARTARPSSEIASRPCRPYPPQIPVGQNRP